MEPYVINKYKTKTTAQLRELSADLKGELKQLRGNLRACEDAVKERERAKQSKFAELREASAGSALDWVRLKHGAQFPEVFDACIEEARDAAQDAQGRVSEMEARLVAIQEKIDKVDAASEEGATTLFIHFVPPALRAHGKSDLPWIVHTCDARKCASFPAVQRRVRVAEPRGGERRLRRLFAGERAAAAACAGTGLMTPSSRMTRRARVAR